MGVVTVAAVASSGENVHRRDDGQRRPPDASVSSPWFIFPHCPREASTQQAPHVMQPSRSGSKPVSSGRPSTPRQLFEIGTCGACASGTTLTEDSL
jgi:hypothetical protein